VPPPSSSDTPGVRRASRADEARLRELQGHLDEPAPALLDAALAGTVGECFVAVDANGAPVGYLLAVDGDGGVGPGDGLSGETTPQVHVAELVVAPAARRNGHASALLATLLARRPQATVTLTVAPDNEAARALYEGFGFGRSRELPEFFDDGPGLLLVRRPRPE
jgi:ribosomal-protein-alanine N-acetyltransferase